MTVRVSNLPWYAQSQPRPFRKLLHRIGLSPTSVQITGDPGAFYREDAEAFCGHAVCGFATAGEADDAVQKLNGRLWEGARLVAVK